MLWTQFYHETIRKIIVAFGTTFNNIQLVRKDNDGNINQSMKVPLAYGPQQKFLVRLNEDADLSKQVAITLPRIGFEIKNRGEFPLLCHMNWENKNNCQKATSIYLFLPS